MKPPAAAPALLRECAALLRGLDDGAVVRDEHGNGDVRYWHQMYLTLRRAMDAIADGDDSNILYFSDGYSHIASMTIERIAAIEADNARLREALAAAEAELRQYREPM